MPSPQPIAVAHMPLCDAGKRWDAPLHLKSHAMDPSTSAAIETDVEASNATTASNVFLPNPGISQLSDISDRKAEKFQRPRAESEK